MPTIGLPLRLGPRVAHDAIDRRHDGDGEYQQRGDEDYGFGHIPLTQLAYGMIHKSHALCLSIAEM